MKSWRFPLILMLAGLVLCDASRATAGDHFASTNAPSAVSASAPLPMTVAPTNRISAEEAFRIALGNVKSRVNLLDMRGWFCIRRTEAGAWLVQLKDHADVPPGGLSITVADSGSVSVRLAQDDAKAEAWLSTGTPGTPAPNMKMRPEVAFRKGIDSLKWAPKPLDLRSDTGGKITLSRISNDEWFMDLFGYHGGPLGGYWINIKDEGKVHIAAGF